MPDNVTCKDLEEEVCLGLDSCEWQYNGQGYEFQVTSPTTLYCDEWH